MEKVIKQRTDQNVVMAIIAVIIMPVVVLFIWGVRTGNLTSMVKSLVSPVHPIEIGTDLSQYKGKKVSCSAINISYQVVALYHRNDPEKKLYADSYLVTDSNYENPTLIFFPEEKFEQLKDMYEKTWSSMHGEPELVYPIKAEGFVRQLTGSDIEFYEKAMNNLYGEDSYTHGDNIYYIDDEDVYMKNLHREEKHTSCSYFKAHIEELLELHYERKLKFAEKQKEQQVLLRRQQAHKAVEDAKQALAKAEQAQKEADEAVKQAGWEG